ncbi:hypothetical protein DNTS_023013, partial [Danionella cerebrum]
PLHLLDVVLHRHAVSDLSGTAGRKPAPLTIPHTLAFLSSPQILKPSPKLLTFLLLQDNDQLCLLQTQLVRGFGHGGKEERAELTVTSDAAAVFDVSQRSDPSSSVQPGTVHKHGSHTSSSSIIIIIIFTVHQLIPAALRASIHQQLQIEPGLTSILLHVHLLHCGIVLHHIALLTAGNTKLASGGDSCSFSEQSKQLMNINDASMMKAAADQRIPTQRSSVNEFLQETTQRSLASSHLLFFVTMSTSLKRNRNQREDDTSGNGCNQREHQEPSSSPKALETPYLDLPEVHLLLDGVHLLAERETDRSFQSLSYRHMARRERVPLCLEKNGMMEFQKAEQAKSRSALYVTRCSVVSESSDRGTEQESLTSMSRGRRVTLCMGKMRKESMGRPPHSSLDSIGFRASRNAALLELKHKGHTPEDPFPPHVLYSQQLLESSLLESLVGAVHDVGLKVLRGVVLDDVTDVPYHRVLLVSPVQVLEEPEENQQRAGVRDPQIIRGGSLCWFQSPLSLRDGRGTHTWLPCLLLFPDPKLPSETNPERVMQHDPELRELHPAPFRADKPAPLASPSTPGSAETSHSFRPPGSESCSTRNASAAGRTWEQEEQKLPVPFADVKDDGDVGEQVMVLRDRHATLQLHALLKVTHQDAQTVLIGKLRGDDLKDGLQEHTQRLSTRNLFRVLQQFHRQLTNSTISLGFISSQHGTVSEQIYAPGLKGLPGTEATEAGSGVWVCLSELNFDPARRAPHLRELAPGDVGRSVVLDHDALIFSWRLGWGEVLVLSAQAAGVQASLLDLLIEPRLWNPHLAPGLRRWLLIDRLLLLAWCQRVRLELTRDRGHGEGDHHGVVSDLRTAGNSQVFGDELVSPQLLRGFALSAEHDAPRLILRRVQLGQVDAGGRAHRGRVQLERRAEARLWDKKRAVPHRAVRLPMLTPADLYHQPDPERRQRNPQVKVQQVLGSKNHLRSGAEPEETSETPTRNIFNTFIKIRSAFLQLGRELYSVTRHTSSQVSSAPPNGDCARPLPLTARGRWRGAVQLLHSRPQSKRQRKEEVKMAEREAAHKQALQKPQTKEDAERSASLVWSQFRGCFRFSLMVRYETHLLGFQLNPGLTFFLLSSSSCIFTCSFRTITCLFHSGMARPCSSWVGTRLSASTTPALLGTPAELPLSAGASSSPGGFWGDALRAPGAVE